MCADTEGERRLCWPADRAGPGSPGGKPKAGAGRCGGPAGRWTKARGSRPAGQVSPLRARLLTADAVPRPAAPRPRFAPEARPRPGVPPAGAAGPLRRRRSTTGHLPSAAPPRPLLSLSSASSPQPRCGPTGEPAESEDAAARRGAGGRAPTHLSASSGRREPQGAAPQPHHAAARLCIEGWREAGARRWLRRTSGEKLGRELPPPRTTAV